MDTIFKERVSGSRLLRIQASAATVAKVSLLEDSGTVRLRDLACRQGVTCIAIGEDGAGCEIAVLSGGSVVGVDLVEVPRIQIRKARSYDHPVVCGLASIPSRAAELANVVASLLPQVDHLIVYLNGFDHVPAFLRQPEITVFRSQDYGDYRDNSKYFGLRCFDGEAYFLSVDDDIHYPSDYVQIMVSAIERYQRKAIVGVHGAIYGAGSKLFLDRAVLHFGDPLAFDMPVSALGTGTCAFHTSTLRPDSLEFEQVGMADLVLARIAGGQGILQIALARSDEWLTAQEMDQTGQNLFGESIELESAHDLYVRAGNVPGPGRIRQIVAATPLFGTLLSDDAVSLIAYLEALEAGGRAEKLALPHSEPLSALAGKLRWPSLALAMVRGILRQYWLERRSFVSAVMPVRAKPLALDASVLDEIVSHIDRVVAEMEPVGADRDGGFPDEHSLQDALEVARAHGSEDLTIAIAGVRFLAGGGAKLLEALHAELCNVGFADLAKSIATTVSRLSAEYAAEVLLESSAMHLRMGALDEVLERADKLMEAGYVGQQLLASAGVLAGKAWAEDLVLSLFVNARNRRQLRRVAELGKILRKVPLPICHPELWAEAMPSMDSVVRQVAAGVLLANREWCDRIQLDDLDLGSDVNRLLWSTATRASRGISFSEAVHAVNRVFFAGRLPPVELGAVTDAGFFHALRAEPLPGFRDPSAPLVSVVLAAYNCNETLDYSLRSVAAQSYPNIEVIVIDDCSPVPVELPDWARSRPDIRLHRLDENVGPYECRNIAIGMSSGVFIATHDADDWMHPRKIQRQVETFARSNAVASYTRHIRLLPDGTPALENNGMFMGDGPITSMFRRPLFDALGGFMPVRTRGDMEFKARLVARYRKTRVAHDEAVTLLALDSATSNSKIYTSSAIDELNVSKFKRWYSMEHSISYFRQTAVLPEGMGRLFGAPAST